MLINARFIIVLNCRVSLCLVIFYRPIKLLDFRPFPILSLKNVNILFEILRRDIKNIDYLPIRNITILFYFYVGTRVYIVIFFYCVKSAIVFTVKPYVSIGYLSASQITNIMRDHKYAGRESHDHILQFSKKIRISTKLDG